MTLNQFLEKYLVNIFTNATASRFAFFPIGFNFASQDFFSRLNSENREPAAIGKLRQNDSFLLS